MINFIFGIITGYLCKNLIKKYIIDKFTNKPPKYQYRYSEHKNDNDRISL